MRLTRSTPSASFWTPSSPCSPAFDNTNILRSELRRLFRWLKDKGVTAVITAETGDGKLTRQGIEEYVADCVILLDHRVEEQTSIRRLRVMKYRGTLHGTSEYPFLIGENGLSVLPSQFFAAGAQGADAKSLQRRSAPGHDAGRKRILPRNQHPDLGRRRHRQEQPGSAFCARSLSTGRTRSLHGFGAVHRRSRAQHALHRD